MTPEIRRMKSFQKMWHETVTFEVWMDEVVRFAKDELEWSPKALASIRNAGGWEDYFNEGLTPKEAWSEEYSAAQ